MSVRLIDRETASVVAGMSSRHLHRLHEESDPPPWTGNGYNAAQFGIWLRRRWKRELGVTGDGTVYDYETERARLTKAQADRTELEAQELRGEMVSADLVIEAWGRMLGAMRARLLSMPQKAAPRARATLTDEEAAKLIEREVIEALEELSDDGLPDRTRARRARRSERPEATASADGQRVGGRVPKVVTRKRGRTGKVED